MKIMTSNIRFNNPSDNEHAWPHRLPILKNIISTQGPDLLGTQEGRFSQLKELEEHISLKMADDHRQYIDERMYPCIFYNPEKIEVLASGDIWLSQTPFEAGTKSFESAFPRLCTWIKAQDLNGKIFHMINTHLDHMYSHTRHEQIKVLLMETKKLGLQDTPWILTGDFNESPVENVRKEIDQLANLRDPWIEKKKKEISTFHKFNGQYDLKFGGARIDWILTTNDFFCEELEAILEEKNGIFPSDHFPIIGRYQF